MKRITVYNTFARDTGPKFREGQRVWYRGSFGNGPRISGVIEGIDEKDGRLVYDVLLDQPYQGDKQKWGYEQQFEPRGAKDLVGSKEDVAYGEGYHSSQRGNPYTDPVEAKAWERGRAKAKMDGKLKSGYYKGEIRNKRFEAPGPRDYKSEQGYVGRVMNSNGSVIAQSEPRISERSVKAWLNAKAEEFIKQGKRVTTKYGIEFYDPAYARA